MGLVQALRRTFKITGAPPPKQMTYSQLRKTVAQQREAKKRDRRTAMLQRQNRRELSGFYEDVPSVAAAMAAQGSGKKMRRHKIDPTGKRRPSNLVRVW